MRFTSAIAASVALLSSAVKAQDVACLVDGETVAVVDLDTGVCPFTIPAELPQPFFEFVSLEDYDVLFYYSQINGSSKFFTDIINAGNVINIPANLLYGQAGAPLYQVHAEEEPSANSTAAIRKRLMKLRGVDIDLESDSLAKRQDEEELVAQLQELEGTFIQNSVFEVVDAVPSSGASSVPEESSEATGVVSTIVSTVISTELIDCTTITGVTTLSDGEISTYTTTSSLSGVAPGVVTEEVTTVVTVTSCSSDLCHVTTVPATPSLVTATAGGVVTVYTTYCPIESVAPVESTKTITITSCHNDACHTSAVAATPAWTTETVGGTVTEYITYCPVTAGHVETKVVVAGTTTLAHTGPGGEVSYTTSTVYITVQTTHGHVGTASAPIVGGAAPSTHVTGAAPSTHVTGAASTTHVVSGATPTTHVVGQTVAAGTHGASTAAVTAYQGGASSNSAKLLALAVLPLAYFF
ncbi:uncharacterized protein LODBEIA_P35780 [Lodderomyces beijingensis]|uniref:Uncharacterized protein n=1 Tax=Lodderomyces beijingensis TaxID=1775926 RepID=A0ABP0ZMI4_9ASCO